MSVRKLSIELFLILATQVVPVKAQVPDPQTPEQKIQELERKVEDLDQRVRVSDRTRELEAESAADKARSGATVGAEPTGITIRSNDQNFLLKIGLDIQLDNRTFPGESSVPFTDQILIRRARPAISGTVYKYVDFYLRPDFGQGSTVLYEAYMQLNYFSRANLRVGKFKPPVGLERLQSDDDTSFIERGLPTLLVPSRDIGYQVSGDIVKRRVSYTVGVFNGVPDNGLSDASVSDHRDYAARIFLTPFLPNTNHPLSGLGFGIGASSGNDDGIPLPSYKTFGQNTFFSFASGVVAAGHRTRLAPQGYYYNGPFGIFAEYTLAEEGLQKGTVRRSIAFRAWQVQASYLLTGDKKGFTTLTPRKSFDPKNHGWGAIELAVRTGAFSVERGFFDYGFGTVATSPRSAREWVGGVNWYLNRAVRISLDYGNTNFGGGATAATGGNRPTERALLQRFQINF
ncbi:MAG: OprO/OprP family phosphate-selective porin [Acidobacteriia bacterium]|nr:OprO/OprP family phosphate-selective porin [Terriglobia bacterium]